MPQADWPETLEQLNAALSQATAELERHEQTLAAPLLSGEIASERHDVWRQCLERFEDRIQQCQDRVRRAEQDVAAAEFALVEQENHIRQHRQRIAEACRQLAQVPGGGIE